MAILAGALAPDAGSMTIDGRPYAPRSPIEARRAGVAMIYQELSLRADRAFGDRAGEVVAAALPEAAALRSIQGLDVHGPPDEAIAHSVGELVDHDRGIERGVSVRTRHQPHAHDGTRALDRRVHVGRPVDRSAVSPRLDPVGRQATPAEVVVLEVSVGFPEAEQIEVVVEEAADVEEVQDLLLVAPGIGRVEGELAVTVSSKGRAGRVEVGDDGVARGAVALHPIVGEPRGEWL